MMQKTGRVACEKSNATYPADLEQAVLLHVARELGRMGFNPKQATDAQQIIHAILEEHHV